MNGGINRKTLYLVLLLLYQYQWFLKWHNFASSGGEAKVLIKSGYVKVNGEVEKRRGRKLVSGDKVMFLKNELIFE